MTLIEHTVFGAVVKPKGLYLLSDTSVYIANVNVIGILRAFSNNINFFGTRNKGNKQVTF